MINPFLTRPIPPPARFKKSDPQRSRLYKMEREFVGTSIYHKVSRADLQIIADHACRYYKIPLLRIIVFNKPEERIFGESVRYVHHDGRETGHHIRLNRGFHGANVTTLIHELAHYVHGQYYTHSQDHGPRWCAIYMQLLHKYRIIPRDAFRVIAKRWRIKIAHRFRPDALR